MHVGAGLERAPAWPAGRAGGAVGGADPHALQPRVGAELERAIGGWPAGGLVAVCGVGRTHVAGSVLATARGWAQVEERARRAAETVGPRTARRTRSSGREGRELAHALVADSVAGRGGPVAWVDPGRRLFPPTLARLGVDLGRLLWVTPQSTTDALWATHVLLSAGGFDRVVLDLRGDRIDQRVERAVQRLQRDAEGSSTVAFLLTPDPIGGVSLTLACREDAGGLAVAWQARRGAGRRVGELWFGGRGRCAAELQAVER